MSVTLGGGSYDMLTETRERREHAIFQGLGKIVPRLESLVLDPDVEEDFVDEIADWVSSLIGPYHSLTMGGLDSTWDCLSTFGRHEIAQISHC